MQHSTDMRQQLNRRDNGTNIFWLALTSSMKQISFVSPWRALQIWFWVFDDQTNFWVAKMHSKSGLCPFSAVFLDTITGKRFIRSNWSQKTFDRAFQELQFDFQLGGITWKTSELSYLSGDLCRCKSRCVKRLAALIEIRMHLALIDIFSEWIGVFVVGWLIQPQQISAAANEWLAGQQEQVRRFFFLRWSLIGRRSNHRFPLCGVCGDIYRPGLCHWKLPSRAHFLIICPTVGCDWSSSIHRFIGKYSAHCLLWPLLIRAIFNWTSSASQQFSHWPLKFMELIRVIFLVATNLMSTCSHNKQTLIGQMNQNNQRLR